MESQRRHFCGFRRRYVLCMILILSVAYPHIVWTRAIPILSLIFYHSYCTLLNLSVIVTLTSSTHLHVWKNDGKIWLGYSNFMRIELEKCPWKSMYPTLQIQFFSTWKTVWIQYERANSMFPLLSPGLRSYMNSMLHSNLLKYYYGRKEGIIGNQKPWNCLLLLEGASECRRAGSLSDFHCKKR